MYQFTYHRPTSLDEAKALLAENEDAKLLAGGHSLIPVMKLRLASPSAIVDLSRVSGLSEISNKDGMLSIGAMARHADVAKSSVAREMIPALADVPGSIGDPHVRHRGTIGGSVANNDPNADYPAACLALGATIVTTDRTIEADQFFRGMFETALEPGEIITEFRFPVPEKAAYRKFKHPASGFALVGVFVAKTKSGVRVAATGAGANGVFRVKAFEEALAKDFSADAIKNVQVSPEGLNSDIHGSAEYRANLVNVLARRALASLA